MKCLPRRWSAAAAALALSLLGAMPAFALPDDDCVEVPRPVSAKAAAAISAVGVARDAGNVTVITIDGDYARGNTPPRQAVAQRYYEDHPDTSDFLIVFTTFEFATGDKVRAFYNPIKNDVTGLGNELTDVTGQFGSAGRLQGYIDMAAMSRMAASPSEPAYENDLNTLAHETLHRWGIALHYRDAANNDSTALLGQDGLHWSYFLDTDASVMYGSDWRAREGGGFEAVAIRRRYSPLDLYVAGFAAASEVPPMTLIRNGDGNATDYPALGAISGGTAETVTIEQIVAANGPRVPSAADSPKDFRAAIILLKRPGESVPPALLYRLETFRTRFQQRFAQMTDGRGLMRIYTERKNAASALPQILAGSGNTAAPAGVPAAAAWLESRQQADGHWEDRPATALRDTVAAMCALEQIAPNSTAIAKARAWIASRTVANLDQRAWQHLATRDPTQRDALTAAQTSDGGWGLAPGWQPGMLDTATVGDLLARAEPGAAAVDQALAWLAPRQNADGSFGMTDGGRGRMLPTLHAARLLNADALPASRDAAQRAADWLGTRRFVGGFGDESRVSLTDTIELYAMVGQVPLSGPSVSTARSVVRARQQIDGDWGGSVYLTATAALASSVDLRINFALAAPPTAAPAAPADGDRVVLAATVVNNGTVAALPGVARWYDGDPAQGGVPIGADVTVPALAPGARAATQATWDTTNRAGAHTLHVVLDPDAAVTESREDDNTATLSITVGAVSSGPDLQMLASDLALDPASVDSLPKSIRLTGIVRNIGSVPVSGARIVVNAAATPGVALASAAVDVPARGSAPVDLTFTVANTSQLLLAVRADPDGTIAEASETNNEARLMLGAGASTDLVITPADLSLSGPAVAGRDVNVRVAVRNTGTVAAPPAALHIEIVQNGTTYALLDGSVIVPAGGTVERVLPWRAPAAGAAQLRAVVDGTNQVAEADEGNNAAQIDFAVESLDGPDIAVVPDSLAFTPTPGVQGQPLVASLRVRNLGADVATPFVVALHAGDPRVGAARIGATTVNGLAAAAETVVSITVPDLGLNGEPGIFAQADADNVLAELDENNNLAVKALPIVSLPDLAVSLADIELTPTLPVAGAPVRALVQVRNFGGQDAHNVVVRLAEGDATTATPVGDRTIAMLPANGIAEVEWQWTLGVQANARSIVVTADPADTVREVRDDNNAVVLPFDVQNGDFYASELYISPNGDGVRDETALVFRIDQGPASIRIVGGLGNAVRTFAGVALNADGRGQVIWDGRDDYARVVVDGDYRVEARDAADVLRGVAYVTVDNNRSSVFEAIDTPHAVESPARFEGGIPPLSSPRSTYAFGLHDVPASVGTVTGLYRAEALIADYEAVVSGRWVEKNGAVENFALSPDGSAAAFTARGTTGTRVYVADAAGTDAIEPLQEASDTIPRTVFGWFGNDEVLVVRDDGSTADVIDRHTRQVRSFGTLPNGYRLITTPGGLLVASLEDPPAYYRLLPRGTGQPAIELEPESFESGVNYDSQLSSDASHLLLHKRTPTRETLELVDFSNGNRRTLVDRDNEISTSPYFSDVAGGVGSVRELAFRWIDGLGEIAVVDGRARELLRYSLDGEVLGRIALPLVDRAGPYALEPRQHRFAHAFPSVEPNVHCVNLPTSPGDGRRVYDPSTRSLFVHLKEMVGVRTYSGSEDFAEYLDGIAQFATANVDTATAATPNEATLVPLTLSADQFRYPQIPADCPGRLPATWPELILHDGARLVADGRVVSPSRGLPREPWRYADSLAAVWPDEDHLTLGTTPRRNITSLLNGYVQLDATEVDYAFVLSGIAADRNFARYELDYASIATPAQWHPVAPPGSDEVRFDEFLTWMPPAAGTYTVRLRVFDRAGNVTSAQRTIVARRAADIDGFEVAPRYFSPNGDGIKDVADVNFRVLRPVSLTLVVKDENGNEVYREEGSFGSPGGQAMHWDGRNQGGVRMPEGRYRLELGGFASWTVLDVTAPTFDAVLQPLYEPFQKNGFPPPPYPDLEVSSIVDANPVDRVTEAISALDGSVTVLKKNVTASAYGNSSFRITLTDRAGNGTVKTVGRGPERFILWWAGNLANSSARADMPRQPLPWDETTIAPVSNDTVMIIDEDDGGGAVSVLAAIASLKRTGLQYAPIGEPSNWSEPELSPPEYGKCDNPLNCWPAIPDSVVLRPKGSDFPHGVEGRYYLRAVGEREDGTLAYSNAIPARLGGMNLFCSGSQVYVEEFYEGLPRELTVRWTKDHTSSGTLVPPDMTANPIGFAFRMEPNATYNFKATLLDGSGRSHERNIECSPTDSEPENAGVSVDVLPVIVDRCDGTPSDRLRVVVTAIGIGRAPLQYRYRYVEGRSGHTVYTEATPGAQRPPEIDVDTHDWSAGSYAGALEGAFAAASGDNITWETLAEFTLPVEKAPPQVRLSYPADGMRICAKDLNRVVGDIASPSSFAYNLSTGKGDDPQDFGCKYDGQPLPERDSPPMPGRGGPPPCLTRLADATSFGFSAFAGLRIWDPAHGLPINDINGDGAIQLKAVNWSGGTVCTTTRIYLDSAVELTERRPSPQRFVIDGNDVIALAPESQGNFKRARLLLHANEDLAVTADVYAANAPDEPLARIAERNVNGDFDIEWGGEAAGAGLSEGYYDIVVQALDGCGQTGRMTWRVYLKRTLPAVAFTLPTSGALVTAAVVDVRGTVTDALLDRWTLAVQTPDSPGNGIAISSGIYAMQAVGGAAPQLAAWSRGRLTGPVTLVLKARDVLGNEGIATLPIVLGDPAVMIEAASLNPLLFSPNGDGALDATRLELSLARAANVAIRAKNSRGVIVATLYAGLLDAQTGAWAWDGRSDGASLPDGEYTVVIDATDPGGAASPEQAVIAATIDSTAPAVALIAPTTGFIRPEQSIRLTVSDVHLVAWDATLTRGGSVAATTQGTTSGDIAVPVPSGAPEGAYTLRITARDGAGNRVEKTFDFVLDSKPPVVDITAPADQSVVPSATPTTVRGTAKDENFTKYTLEIAPATSDFWQPLAAGTSPIDAADVLAWTPNRPDGDYRLRLRAEDKAGNTAEAVRAVTVDGTPPVATITRPATNDYVRREFDVEGSATDAHFAEYRVALIRAASLPNGAWSDVKVGTEPVNAALLAKIALAQPTGDYVLRLTVKDLAGLTSTAQVPVKLDAEPPPVPLQLTGRVENNRHARLAWNAVTADDLAGYHVYRGGARVTTAPVTPTQYTDTDAPEGSLVYTVTAVDNAGNESAPSNAVTLLIDHTAPTVSLAKPADGERVRAAYEIAGTAWSRDDFHEYRLILEPLSPPGAPVVLRRGSLPVQSGTLAVWNTLDFADETRVRVRLEADDRNGNVASAPVEVTVDNGPPAAPTGVVAALADAPGAPCTALGGTARDVRVCWNANTESDLLGYLVWRDGKLLNAPATPPADLRPFAIVDPAWLDAAVADGAHTYVVHAIDRAGNISAPSDPAELAPVDFGPPHVEFVRPVQGTEFDTSLAIHATTEHRDIATVQFAYRRDGDAAWTDIGSAFTAEPYRLAWTPGAIPYGDYDLRAVAIDATGNVDPAPPVVRVKYADLTPPAVPATLTALADGGTVSLAWTASASADVARYEVSRYEPSWQGWNVLGEGTALTYDDSGLEDGAWRYRVVAIDAYGNRSAPSGEATAHVFGLVLKQPFTPTVDASVAITGRSARTGSLAIHVENAQGASDLPAVTLDAQGNIALAPLALQPGSTHATFRVTDTAGNRSRAAELWIDRGARPATPTGLAAAVNGHDVTVSWNANAEPDIAGYRVFRRGQAAPVDVPLAETPTAESEGGGSPESAIDGDLATAWDASHEYTELIEDDANDPTLTLSWSTPRLVVAANLTWLSAAQAAGNVDLQGWSGHAWVTVASARGTALAERSLVPVAPYRTDKVRLVVRGPGRAGFADYRLAEIVLVERPLLDATSVTDTLIDGRYDYRVSAVNAYGFESDRTEPVTADVGDAEPPAAVTLSGTLAGNAAHLSWTASASADAARYQLRRDGAVVADLPANAPLAYDDNGLRNGPHTWVVVVYDTFDNASEPSNAVTLTVAESGPGIPVVRVAAPAVGGMLDIAWDAGAGTTPVRYVLRRATSASGPFVETASVSATTYRDAPLVNGTAYWYTVEAVDAAGNASGPSAPVSGTPRDVLSPGAPVLGFPTVASTPVTMYADATRVCGFAEPGSRVAITRDGLPVAEAQATSVFGNTTIAIDGITPRSVVVAGDGRTYAVERWSGQITWHDMQTGATGLVTSTGQGARWSSHGLALYYMDQAGNAVVRLEPGRNAEPLGIAVENLREFDVDEAGRQVLFAGDYAPNGTAERGVWLANIDGTNARRIGGIEADALNFRGLRFSPDGTRALVHNGDRIDVVDTRTASIVATHAAFGNAAPAWSSDGRYAYGLFSAQDTLDVIVRNAADGSTRTLLQGRDTLYAFAWSPDDTRLLVTTYGSADVIDVNTGASTIGGALPDAGSDVVSWTASGRIALWPNGGPLRLIDLPGAFCSDAVPLVATRHVFGATARDASGNTSLPAGTLEVLREAQTLPDFAIGASDVLVVPVDARPGDAASALVTIRNAGGVTSPASVAQATLVTPAGTTRPLTMPPVPALAAGAASVYTVDLGVLDAAGTWRVRIMLDPANQVIESNEANNRAEALAVVTADDAPTLEVHADRTLFAPGDRVTGEVAVAGVDAAARVRVAVVDASGDVVDELGEYAVGALGRGERWTRAVQWNAAGVVAGDYRLRARLLAATGNTVQIERYGAFAIQPLRHVVLTVQPGTNAATVGTTLSVRSVLAFTDGNAPIEGARLRLVAVPPAGNEIVLADQALGTLLAGYEIRKDVTWNTSGLAPGAYGLRLRLSAPGFQTVLAESSVTLDAAVPVIVVAGTLDIAPDTSLVAGMDGELRYSVRNRGEAALAGVTARVRVTAAGATTPVAQAQETFDLAAGNDRNGTLVLATPPLVLGTYSAVLEARLAGDAPDTWRVLARSGFGVVDAIAPEVTLLTPAATVLQPAVVNVRAVILDRHSSIAASEFAIDGGAWQPFSLGADGYYARGVAGLADGAHRIAVRARDAWGNETRTAETAFTVDATPPVIVIAGVADGDYANAALAPTVTIDDAHSGTSDIRLNGATYVSGTPITADGDYLLSARATDAAGNMTYRSVHFVIDRTPPTVVIASPADGAVVTQSTIGVFVNTEPGATATLAVGAWQAQALASAAGVASFANVPLALGDNTLAATAHDRAGNDGGTASVHVRYQPDQGATLVGTLQPGVAQLPQGSALAVNLHAENTGTAPLPAQRLRVQAMSGGNVLAEQIVTHDFAAGEAYTTDLTFDSATWPLGRVDITLAVERGGNWTGLDAEPVDVVDRTLPTLAVVAPAAGAVIRAPVTVRATASDALTGIASVEARIDGGAWSALTATATPGEYAGAPLKLADGDHTAELRATDGAGNTREAPTVTFAVDNTAPSITIAGVADGDLLAHAVTPTITVTDVHPDTRTITLNGAPYVSGTPIGASGAYALHVEATDRAGNTAQADVAFTLDLEAPTLVVTSPVDGTTVNTATIAITGTTEPLAKVEVAVGTFAATVFADANGAFSVPGATLALGANTVTAHATDRAGNAGSPVSLVVHYVPDPVPLLEGDIGTLAAATYIDRSLHVPYTVRNPTAVAASGVPVRVSLFAAGATSATASQSFTATVAPHAAQTGEAVFTTNIETYAAGTYTVRLEAFQAAAWQVLDESSAYLRDHCRQPRAAWGPSFADGFEGTVDLIFCDDFENWSTPQNVADSPLQRRTGGSP